mmetsp:Transcript_43032/g.84582  ORF Transcript_43032/g.84582 Transcript_43032/m.84582 type:complete len:133 (-) Transcript_43032:67-465(-)
MLRGEDGLGAFLSDGSGYNRSKFRPSAGRGGRRDGSPVSSDPLPWLRLPALDFVEVAGQEKKKTAADQGLSSAAELEFVKRLEAMAEQVRVATEAGDVKRARAIGMELDQLIKGSGYEYLTPGQKPFKGSDL